MAVCIGTVDGVGTVGLAVLRGLAKCAPTRARA
jgi:hypothetical protein